MKRVIIAVLTCAALVGCTSDNNENKKGKIDHSRHPNNFASLSSGEHWNGVELYTQQDKVQYKFLYGPTMAISRIQNIWTWNHWWYLWSTDPFHPSPSAAINATWTKKKNSIRWSSFFLLMNRPKKVRYRKLPHEMPKTTPISPKSSRSLSIQTCSLKKPDPQLHHREILQIKIEFDTPPKLQFLKKNPN